MPPPITPHNHDQRYLKKRDGITPAEGDARYAPILTASREYVVDASALSGDIIPDINTTIAEAAANGGGRVAIPTGKTFAVRPDLGHIELADNVTLDLGDAILQVASATGPYDYLISATTPATAVERVRVTGGMIDQNAGGATSAVITPGSSRSYAVLLYNADGLSVVDTTFKGPAVNFVMVNGENCRNAEVSRCTFTFDQGASTEANYDNSAVYLEALGMAAHGNRFYSTIADAARGAVELHGPIASMTGNIAHHYQTLANVVSSFTAFADADDGFVVVSGNSLYGGNYGVQLWPQTGDTLHDVRITDNVLALDQIDWGGASAAGVLAVRTAGNDGTIDGLTIADNTVRFQPSDTRSGLEASTTVGVGLVGRGETHNATVTDNTVINAPGTAYRIGDSAVGGVVRGAEVYNNTAIDAGGNTNISDTRRAAFHLEGELYDTEVHDNLIRDTGSASLVGKWAVNTAAASSGSRNSVYNNRQRTASGSWMYSTQAASIVNPRVGKTTVDLASLAAGATTSFTISIPGAATRDLVMVTPSGGLESGLTYTAGVSAADTITVRVTNASTGAIDPANRVWRAVIIRPDIDN